MKTLLTLFLLSTILCSCGISTEYLNNALIKAERIDSDAERLRRNIITFKRRLKDILETQMDLVDDIDKLDIEK